MWRPRPGHINTACAYPLNAFMLFRYVALYGEDVNKEALLRLRCSSALRLPRYAKCLPCLLQITQWLAHTAPSSQNKLHEALALKQLEFQMQDLPTQGA